MALSDPVEKLRPQFCGGPTSAQGAATLRPVGNRGEEHVAPQYGTTKDGEEARERRPREQPTTQHRRAAAGSPEPNGNPRRNAFHVLRGAVDNGGARVCFRRALGLARETKGSWAGWRAVSLTHCGAGGPAALCA
ncbi:unnamed protein product [Lampetra planeri]